MGCCWSASGSAHRAIEALEAATELAPDQVVPLRLLANILANSSRTRQAEVVLRRLIAMDPYSMHPANALATVLIRMMQHAEARTILLDLLDRHGPQTLLLSNLTVATFSLGLQDEALELANRAIRLDPEAVLPRRALCSALPYHDRATGASVLSAMRECSAVLPRIPQPPLTNTSEPDRPLVVGLLSGSFKSHPVGWLTVAGIETLDPGQFSVICLAQATLPTDAMCQRFRAVASEWVETECMTDAALVDAARTRAIDILIDLGGYGDTGRMTACANRLAPVQIKWVGMQSHSSGLAEMDWFLTDRWETPDGFERLYSEKLLRLADGYVCYSPPPYAPDVGPLPALEEWLRHLRLFQQSGEGHASCDRDLGGNSAAPPDRPADPEDSPVVRPSHGRRLPGRLRRASVSPATASNCAVLPVIAPSWVSMAMSISCWTRFRIPVA